MSQHTALLQWRFTGGDFLRGKYSRDHTWTFDGGLTIPASPAPGNAPKAFMNLAGIDPEEALVASLASCHMLTFLYVAFRGGFAVESYEDHAAGTMAKNDRGRNWISRVTLRPRIVFHPDHAPSREQVAHLHHEAHEECIIANSVKTAVVIEAA